MSEVEEVQNHLHTGPKVVKHTGDTLVAPLGGSWVVLSGVISRATTIITPARGL